ncbi:MAG: tRNA (uridine(34)/cytosine(34)/5-carboxymethylaminomethyluridine(34)-2'-O)-methyltransferase TrmL [Clostridia bacterium]|nr:tRNA (uridine(34)/cytosine(34)/5-carboxymethylaminomethyluridine(34)-2'-O)-methyltransferase TrmL [Clostridia bacterium]
MPEQKRKLHIVLVEPEIPQNTGNIARTCAAIGAGLHLIEPLGFEISDRYLKRAGLDYWQYLDLHTYPNLSDFFEKNRGAFYYFTTKGKNNYTRVTYEGEVYLFFGKETKGLPEDLLRANLDRALRLPMKENIRSLNLSNSVAIAAFEVLRQWNFEGFQTEGFLPEV